MTFTIPSYLLLSNCDIRNVEIDYGTGFTIIQPDKSLSATLKSGINKVNIRVTLRNGKQLNAHTIVLVEDVQPLQQTRAGIILNNDSLVCHYSTVISGESYRGISTSAEIFISYAPGRSSLRKPLLIVEGFDPRIDEKLLKEVGILIELIKTKALLI